MHPAVLSFVVGLSLLAGSAPTSAAGDAASAAPMVRSAELDALQARVASAEQSARMVPVLAGLVVVLGAGVAVLGWCLVRRRPVPPAPMPPEPVAPDPDTVKLPAAAPAEPPSIPVTAAYFPSAASASSTPHGLSIEEHIDIDQQAEFLVVLGQDDAAIDLLLEHLRGTGGTSPLPYLRLMQIYRRRDDQAAYERTRERFNQRFNALAPQWRAETGRERSLADYPEAIGEVQRAWSAPLDAMAVIESLLFRRGTEEERFDLPAYEELLFLYWLTRELQHRTDAPASEVDVLLPIEDTQTEVSVIQRTPASFDSTGVFTQVNVSRRPGGVDVDLSTVPAAPDDQIDR
jgi:pilus assembly protein FimV